MKYVIPALLMSLPVNALAAHPPKSDRSKKDQKPQTAATVTVAPAPAADEALEGAKTRALNYVADVAAFAAAGKNEAAYQTARAGVDYIYGQLQVGQVVSAFPIVWTPFTRRS